MIGLQEAVGRNAYPGRGIIMGRSEGGAAVCAYFVMGRSVNSRNRVFVQEGDGLRTRAHDPQKLADPSLVIYAPVRVLGPHTIVTNGDQTDTIHEALTEGKTFEDALRTRTFEPDGPHWTPRVSGLLTLRDGAVRYALSILKRAPDGPEACQRFFFEYEGAAGQGHFLHTYAGDGDPLPSFAGEPAAVRLAGDIDALTACLWNCLNAQNRVALFVRFIPMDGTPAQTRVCNKLA